VFKCTPARIRGCRQCPGDRSSSSPVWPRAVADDRLTRSWGRRQTIHPSMLSRSVRSATAGRLRCYSRVPTLSRGLAGARLLVVQGGSSRLQRPAVGREVWPYAGGRTAERTIARLIPPRASLRLMLTAQAVVGTHPRTERAGPAVSGAPASRRASLLAQSRREAARPGSDSSLGWRLLHKSVVSSEGFKTMLG
jgi:hypothetical protein